MLTINPEVAAEWHPTKNGDLKPEQVTANSNVRVWWQCSKGHEWQALIFNRNKGAGRCPVCEIESINEKAVKLAIAIPELAKEWHPTKNGELTPEQVPANYKKPVWWQCEKGHEWQVAVNTRRMTKSGCPICGQSKVRAGHNDLITKAPELARQWHPSKNGTLTPDQVAASNQTKVWWQCEKGHEWQAVISSRYKGAGCPACTRINKIRASENRLSLNVLLAKEWHPTKNGELTPDDVTTGSGQKVWWQCEKGHEWQTSIINRSKKGTGCPVCHKKKRKTEADE